MERFLNFGLTTGELQGGRPIIGIAQSPMIWLPAIARIFKRSRVCAMGVRDAGGVPRCFPMHPLQENVRRTYRVARSQLGILGLG